MRRYRMTVGAVLALVIMAAPAVAQAGHGRGGGPGAWQGRGMMAGGPAVMSRNPAAVVLERRAELDLTEEQVRRIEAIRTRVDGENGPRIEQLKAGYAAIAGDRGVRDLTVEERRAVRDRMSDLQPLRDQVRATNRAAGAEIHELLTPEQEAKLVPLMHTGARERRPARGGRGVRGPRGVR